MFNRVGYNKMFVIQIIQSFLQHYNTIQIYL